MNLRAWQAEAVPLLLATLRRGDRALLSACTGAGKSITVAALIADVLTTLKPGWCIVVTVPTESLVEQLAATLRKVLPVPVGRWYGKRKEPGVVRVCCIPSLPGLVEQLTDRCALWVGDEVHRAESPHMLSALDALKPARWLGVTATPYRSDTGLTHWPSLTYRYPMDRAFREGVLVRPRPLVPLVGDPGADDVVEAVRAIVARRPEAIGPTVLSAANIPEAEERAERMGWLAYHSKQSTAVRTERMRMLEAGEVPGLVHVRALSEGVDMPWLRVMALGTEHGRNRVGLVQEVGRVLRSHPGKDVAWVIDPHRLMARMNLEEIGQLIQAADDPEEEERIKRETEQEEERLKMLAVDNVRQVEEAIALLDELRFMEGGQVAGTIKPETLAEIERCAKSLQWVGKRHREQIRRLFDARATLDESTGLTLARVLTVASARVAEHRKRGGDWSTAPRLDLTEPCPPAPRCRRCGSLSEWQRSRGGIMAWCNDCNQHPTATANAQPGDRIAMPARLFIAPHLLPQRDA